MTKLPLTSWAQQCGSGEVEGALHCSVMAGVQKCSAFSPFSPAATQWLWKEEIQEVFSKMVPMPPKNDCTLWEPVAGQLY